ncbi:separin-like isoform X2 [Salvelinus fontinalis]|nr:separin-like isoform X2 [Salvelinus fontinalis]XP_055725422.1 separin-like isoform X2 [Salvelinus fontinalis]
MASVQKKQKAVSCVSEKAKLWDRRRALNTQMERLLEEMEGLLGCWRGLLLPLTCDHELSVQVKRLQKTLTAWGALTSEEMLKAVLSASPLLSQSQLQWFAQGVCGAEEGVFGPSADNCGCTGREARVHKDTWCSSWTGWESLTLAPYTQIASNVQDQRTKRNDALSLCRGDLRKVYCGMNTLPMSVTAVITPSEMFVLSYLAVPPEAATGEHLLPQASLCHPHALSTLTTWPLCSKRV